MKLEHYFLYRDLDVDIKKVDKIKITDVNCLTVNCLTGPTNTLIVTKNNYPKFDELLSILEKYNGRNWCTSYIIISFYKGYEDLGYTTIDFSDCPLYKEASNAIDQAKKWLKQKQKL